MFNHLPGGGFGEFQGFVRPYRARKKCVQHHILALLMTETPREERANWLLLQEPATGYFAGGDVPHFLKMCPQMYPHIPPDSGTLRRTFSH